VRRLRREDCEVLTVDRATLDLRDSPGVAAWLERERPDAVFLAAARVGGILANDTRPVDFLLDNLQIETAVLAGAQRARVGKLLFLGSSCIYPKHAEQPITEESLLTGPLEPTNEWYAIAKIAGIKLADAYRKQYGCDFISAMPTNLYGPGDNYDPLGSHVMPALIRKVHAAAASGAPIEVWGSGSPRREFLHVDDCADACVHLVQHWSGAGPVNVGAGEDISIADLARMIVAIAGSSSPLVFDPSKPDGTPRKLLDVSKLAAMGWRASIPLGDGVARTYAAYAAAQR
jgi:GDP-L-fucose synthase